MAAMSAQLVLALCLIAIAWVKIQAVPTQQVATDVEIEGSDPPLWDDNEDHQILSLAGADSFLPSYEITEVKPLSEGSDPLLYLITIEGKPCTMSLEKQTFLPIDFQVLIDDKVDTRLSNFIKRMRDCFYSGQILESTGSSVTIRTCLGLRGMIEFINGSFIIEPQHRTPGPLHVIYKMEASEDVPIFISENDTNLNDHGQQRSLLKPLRTIDKITPPIFRTKRSMKVSLFVTIEACKVIGPSPQTVLTRLLQVFSYINTKFVPLQMEVFLSTVDLWTKSSPCVIADSVSDTLENFIDWLSGLPSSQRRFDLPLLIVDGQHSGAGKTYFGQMCSNNNGAVVTFPEGLSLEKFSCLISHILGHNIGMLHHHHHSGECFCPASPCLMDVNMPLAANSKTFSNCSLKEFHSFVQKTGAACLLTHPYPNTKPLADPSLCGNQILDTGESCDCGTEVECGKDACCDYRTCTLKPDAKCDSGSCCSKCQFLPSGTLCREESDECDLQEYCSGTMADCPEDVFHQNGNPCNGNRSVCFDGICQNIDIQCAQFFGPASRNADLECYQKLNVIGDRFGNCGGVKGLYKSCQPQDVLCGKIHCVISDGKGIFRSDMAISYFTSKHHICLSGDLLTDHIIDPLWSKDGTKCGENKTCINKKCTDIFRSNATCKRETTCHGHGVCNNKHQCYCEAGWSPPFCSTYGKIGGRSGSNDTEENSGKCPSAAVENLRIWLLIVFLVIYPVILIIVFIFVQRFLSTNAKSISDSTEDKDDDDEEE
ncbi:disintegrin and metalloproteinase domain-containing protein 9-like [Dendropsophus ebraccatus]|uniref:disintegrin and metalloproteinase domain-containing protein 9-like n=1 Tax=Dendropsophus ebraccatus TaxID=150705 RepID=UPI00383180E4